MSELTNMAAWHALQSHREECAARRVADLFDRDPDRASRFSLSVGGLHLDYSKQRIDERTLALLLALAEARDLARWRARMFEGDPINVTEGRAVLHAALRDRSGAPWHALGERIDGDVEEVRERMLAFVDAIHRGEETGLAGKPFRHVLVIGIGGSHLGPEAACEALATHHVSDLDIRFLSNIDGHDAVRALEGLDPLATLVIVASKTFTTLETMVNARTVRDWLLAAAHGDARAIARQFVALSTNAEAVKAFGIAKSRMFGFADWVGGRYSLWSSIGLPVALAVGRAGFEAMLDGGHAMDRHFLEAPLARNMPVLMALLAIWNSNFLGAASIAILPYDRRLDRFIDHLQQLDMESNGKRVNLEGAVLDYDSGQIIWGRPGTNGQHAFYQLIHQGTRLVPADIIAVLHPDHAYLDHHALLLANAIAQGEALMRGRSIDEARAAMEADGLAPEQAARLAPHRSFPGNIPTSTLLLERLDPFHFGQLLALYEHKVFVEGAIWNINSFDQWGVELGKVLATRLHREIAGEAPLMGHDGSTHALAERVRAALGRT
ncbi:MAG: glucose-6-phosphate isomerase [Rhodothalassiaceae bacterium]